MKEKLLKVSLVLLGNICFFLAGLTAGTYLAIHGFDEAVFGGGYAAIPPVYLFPNIVYLGAGLAAVGLGALLQAVARRL